MSLIRILIIFSIVLLSFDSSGQEIMLGADSGYQSYDMKYLKGFTTNVSDNIPFQTETMSNYPPYWNIGGFLGLADSTYYEFGVRYSFASTGAKISRRDYSGEYEYSSVICRNSTGLYLIIPLYHPAKLMTRLVLDAGYLWTDLEISEALQLNGFMSYSKTYNLKSSGGYFTPALMVSYYVSPVSIALRAGYEMGIYTGELEGTDLTLPKLNKENPKANWSGAFINVSVAIQLRKLFR